MFSAAKAALLAIMLSVSWSTLLEAHGAPEAQAQRDPPASGDWVVSSPENYSGINILLSGNLTVAAGGNLSLSNVKLSMASPSDGALHIEVQSGGELWVADRDGIPTPLDDATVISSGSSFSYQFWVRPGGRLVMRNSVVKDCGHSLGARGEQAGLYIQSGNCDISNTTFRDNCCGLVVDGCAPRLDNCTFLQNRKYGMDLRDADLRIACNLFDQNDFYGLNVTSGHLRLERNIIRGNYKYGINAIGSTVAMEGNVFQLNTLRAVYAEKSTVTSRWDEFLQNGRQNSGLAFMLKGSSLEIEGASFQDNPYSLHCEDARVVMRNTTMINSTISDIWLTRTADHSEVVSYNCSFKKAGYNDQDSWLEVRWTVDFWVVWDSTGAPVQGAAVWVYDSKQNKLFDLTTNDTGALPWLVLTQYKENQSGRAELNPYRLGIFKGRFYNSTWVTVNKDIRRDLVLDDVPPYFKVTSPKENFTTNRSWINVTGGFNATWKNLTVNREVAYVDPNSCNFSVRVNLTEGANVINLTATDDFYNTYTVFRTVRRDSTPPSLLVDLPEEGLLINRTAYLLTGRTDPGSYMNVNGFVPVVWEDGSFELLMELAEGANQVLVSSADQYLNRIWLNRTILVDTVVPFLEFTSPQFTPIAFPQPPPAAGEYWTNRPLLRLQGNTEAGSELFLGGERYLPAGTNLSFSINLTEGDNLLQFGVRDSAGNWNSTSLLVRLDTVVPLANITYPPEGVPLRMVQTTITGTTEALVLVSSRDGIVTRDGEKFQLACNLSPGPNFITIELRDLAGNVRKMVLNVSLDIVAHLSLDRPANYTTIDGASVRVEGRAEPGACVSVNDRNASVSADGYFTVKVALEKGPNIITINVSDPAGNSATYQMVIFRSEPVPADTGWLVWLAAVIVISIAAPSIGAGVWVLRRRRAAKAKPARPVSTAMPWEEAFERPILRAYEGPEEVLRCARCLQPVSEDWVGCHGCGAPTDLGTVSSETFSRLSETEFQTGRERGLKAALMKARSDISTIMDAGEQVPGQLRDATIAAQTLLRAQRPDLVERKAAELNAELGPLADRLGPAHARELARTREEAQARMKSLLDEVEGALPFLRESGADVRDIERAVEMARVHLRADNLEKAYEFIVEAKSKADGMRGGGPPQFPAT